MSFDPDQTNHSKLVEKNFSLHTVIRLKFVQIAALYALFALGNWLLYWPGTTGLAGSPWQVFRWAGDHLIFWWSVFCFLCMIAFCWLGIKIARREYLNNVATQHPVASVKRLKRTLVLLAILFTIPNLHIANLHMRAIEARFVYWGQVRAAYEVPVFHLLPLLLLLYWWLSSLRHNHDPVHRLRRPDSQVRDCPVADSAEAVVDPLSTVIGWLYGSILTLGAYFVLAFILISLFQRQVVHGVDGGIRVPIDFTALYLYVVSGGVLLGLLIASGVYIYWRRRLYAMADADAFFAMRTGFICLTVWWLPLLVAVGSALTLVFYLHQGDWLVN